MCSNFAFYSVDLFSVILIDGTQLLQSDMLDHEIWDLTITKEGGK